MIRSLAALTALLLSCTAAGASTTCETPIARYHMGFEDKTTFTVDLAFTKASTRLDLYHFTSEGNPGGQAAFVRELEAYDPSGASVSFTETGDGGWEFEKPVTRVAYKISATHDSVDWAPGKDEVATIFDDTYFFVGNAVLMADYEWPLCPAEILFDVPADWHITTPWVKSGDRYLARDWEKITFNAFALGKKQAHEAKAGGLTVSWIAADSLKAAEDDINRIANVLAKAYTDYFGAAPTPNYNAFFFTDKMSDGGAFRSSLAMRIAEPLTETEAISWQHTLGHEMMHLWTSVEGSTDGGAAERTYWFREGFTDYLTLRIMAREGLISEALYEQRLANIIRRYRLGVARRTEADLSKAGSDKLGNWEYIYGAGAMMAWLLDDELAKRGKGGLRPVMRATYAHRSDVFDHPELLALLNAETDGLAEEIYMWVQQDQPIPELRARFAELGYEVSVFGLDEAYVKAERP